MITQVLLDQVVLQKDGRIRLPQAAIKNLGLDSARSLDIYLDTDEEQLVIKALKAQKGTD